MSKAIQGLKPAGVWKYFAEISEIPRPSKHEEKIAAYVLATAKKLGLEAKQDRVGNIVVRKPASKGREKVRILGLGGEQEIVIDGTSGSEAIRITDKAGQTIVMDAAAPSITLTDGAGSVVQLDGSSGNVLITSAAQVLINS